LEYGAIIDAFEEVGFAGSRDLELRDDLLAEARNSNVHGDLPHVQSSRRANLEGLLHRSTAGLHLENLPRQQGIYEVTRLNPVSAWISGETHARNTRRIVGFLIILDIYLR